jgi:ParB family chromosome partitioning protein
VREVEALAAAEAPQDDTPRPGRPRRSAEGDAALRSLEDVLGRALGYSVAVKAKASGEGEIRIRYTSAEERDALCRKLGGACGAKNRRSHEASTWG